MVLSAVVGSSRFPDRSGCERPDADLAVAAVDVSAHTDYTVIPAWELVTRAMLKDGERADRPPTIGIGDDIYYVGRFQPQPNGPSYTTVRFGAISHLPVPVNHPRYRRPMESFLIEARSRAGFSGSPVKAMLHFDPANPHHYFFAGGYHEMLLGLDWGHYPEWQRFTAATASGGKFELSTDLVAGIICVTPAWLIWDLLMRDDVAKERREAEDRWKRDQERGPVMMDAVTDAEAAEKAIT